MFNKYIVLTTILFLINNILVWYQLNSQLVWEWAKGTKSMWLMSLMGIPISLLFSKTAVDPKRLLEISTITEFIESVGNTIGLEKSDNKSETFKNNLFPKLPPG